MSSYNEFDPGFDPENPNPGPGYWTVAFWAILVAGCAAGALAVFI